MATTAAKDVEERPVPAVGLGDGTHRGADPDQQASLAVLLDRDLFKPTLVRGSGGSSLLINPGSYRAGVHPHSLPHVRGQHPPWTCVYPTAHRLSHPLYLQTQKLLGPFWQTPAPPPGGPSFSCPQDVPCVPSLERHFELSLQLETSPFPAGPPRAGPHPMAPSAQALVPRCAQELL